MTVLLEKRGRGNGNGNGYGSRRKAYFYQSTTEDFTETIQLARLRPLTELRQ